jgi:hypothetical protein
MDQILGESVVVCLDRHAVADADGSGLSQSAQGRCTCARSSPPATAGVASYFPRK